MESVLSHTYANGLSLVAEPIPSLESAAFTFLVPAGSVLDPPELSGLSGFTCEMALRGCGSRDSRQFLGDLENLGVERSESVNTGHTTYSGATLARSLPAVLEIYADLLRRPLLPDELLEAGRAVVLQELRSIEDEPSQKVMLELRRHQYGLPWGRPSQGELDALRAISIDQIRAFFSSAYRPDETILGVAGRFDWDALRDQVGELLGDWPSRPAPTIADHESLPRNVHLPHDSNQTQIGIAYDNVPYRDVDYFQAWGGVGVLSGGMSSRLFTEVREKRGLCYSVYASCHTLRDRGSVVCYAGTTAQRAQETLDVTLAELTRLGEGIQDGELDRLKARIKSGLIMQQESSSARSGAIARDWYHLGQARTLDEIGGMVDGLSTDSINRYLAAHPPGGFTIVTLGNSALEVPDGIF